MSMSSRIALVTGANRGIGLEIVKQLAEVGFKVILSARDRKMGEAITSEIKNTGHDVTFHVLDVTNESSIIEAVRFIEKMSGRLDVLINNAAILIDSNQNALSIPSDMLRNVLETNLIGPFRLCQEVIPLMKKNKYGRIVNISSGMGAFNEMGSGYPSYRISKTSLNAMTKILAAELSGSNILVNSMCPGWVRTEMGGPGATRSVAEGADTAVWLAQLPDNGPSGAFFRDRRQISW
jgi:NAD(P)-dependent dehydrogenase (short-subunit alcohol dehydrogenase family)